MFFVKSPKSCSSDDVQKGHFAASVLSRQRSLKGLAKTCLDQADAWLLQTWPFGGTREDCRICAVVKLLAAMSSPFDHSDIKDRNKRKKRLIILRFDGD